ncbi:MAG: response regulator [Planctomycetes bacterium]|jgi:DNA-binding NarL/FixJ family response regulator|nr:response regulator transcription factor [Phycisphaerae bacterium]NBB94147.1 response regulator [Planctomycetota bacterium]
MSIRILIVDDHNVIVDGLRKYLATEMDMEVVGSADNGRDAVSMAVELCPDVVLMDITMPDLNGTEATRQITRQCPDARVLALSMHTSTQNVLQMLQAGASGYVTKGSPMEELVRAVRDVHGGTTYLSQDIADDIDEENIELFKQLVSPAGVLSPREREVLQLVVEGKSSKEIGRDLHVTTKTIEHHRHNIMRKLKINSIPDLTKFAIREGLTSLET